MSGQKHLSRAMLLALLLFVSGNLNLCSADTCRTLTTYNTGLTPKVPDYTLRSHLQGFSLQYEEADILCLQEAWLERDVVPMLMKLLSKYKYHFSPLHSSVNVLFDFRHMGKMGPPCTADDIKIVNERLFPCSIAHDPKEVSRTEEAAVITLGDLAKAFYLVNRTGLFGLLLKIRRPPPHQLLQMVTSFHKNTPAMRVEHLRRFL
ncbi:hypothetical protein ElyMa_001201200 [Elysia marginata]|uniref:Endonuclease/exonuclease/phosphatase domain-containing protein n=1 Tax=Elysia marginata TaxID=1093978 RepID=A0AAV4I4R4_9GAST|nr:hypothetical protein ElyMa_001201200 [Elysia marginata]